MLCRALSIKNNSLIGQTYILPITTTGSFLAKTMKKFLRHTFFVFIPAWAAGFVLASILHTTAVLTELTKIDVSIGFSDWIFMIRQDLLGLLPTYGVIIAVTLALAFFITQYLINLIYSKRTESAPFPTRLALFSLAGAVSFGIMLMAMQPILNVTLIAGARSLAGLLAQCLAGVIAGCVFAYLGNKFNAKT